MAVKLEGLLAVLKHTATEGLCPYPEFSVHLNNTLWVLYGTVHMVQLPGNISKLI